MLHAEDNNIVDTINAIAQELLLVGDIITEITALLCRLPENMDPDTFYERVRPYLVGYKELDGGCLLFEGVTRTEEETRLEKEARYRSWNHCITMCNDGLGDVKNDLLEYGSNFPDCAQLFCPGGSAAQSALIQV